MMWKGFFVRPQKYCTVDISEKVCRTWINNSMILNGCECSDKEMYWLPELPTLIVTRTWSQGLTQQAIKRVCL